MTASGEASSKNKKDEVSLKEILLKIKDWLRFLFSKWWIICLFGILGGILGVCYATFKKAVYTATTTFVLEDDKGGSGLGSIAGLASIAGVDLQAGGGVFQGDNIFELYKSRKMVAQTLLTEVVIAGKKQLLIDKYIDFNKLREKWADKPELANLHFEGKSKLDTNVERKKRLTDSVINVIVSDITKNYLFVAKQDKKLNIIKVDVKASNEDFAKIFNETIVQNVNDFYVKTKTKKALENVKILQQKTDSVRYVMNGAINRAAFVADATPNLNQVRQAQRIAPIQRSQFSAETNKAILSSLIQNLELAKISLRKEAPLIQVIDEPVYPLAKSKYSRLVYFILISFVTATLAIIYLIMARMYKLEMESDDN